MKLLIPILFLMMTGCSGLLKKVAEKPKIELDQVKVSETNLIGTTLLFILSVENPNKMDIKVDEVKYKISLDGKPFASAKNDKEIKVAGNAKSYVTLPLPVKYTDLWSGVKDLITAKTVSYKLEGEAKLSLFNIPFTKEGKLDIRD